MDQYQVFDATRLGLHDSDRPRLRRILARAEADCAAPCESAGAGAQSTRKRAVLLKAILDGASLEDAAAAASLSPLRAAQVLRNFTEHGFAALYPLFAEELAGSDCPSVAFLWSQIKEPIFNRPSHYGIRIGTWTPAAMLDFLIAQGMVEDSSQVRIAKVIAASLSSDRKPITYREAEMRELEAGHAPQKTYPWVGLLVGAVFLGAAFVSFHTGSPLGGWVLTLIGGIVFLFGALVIYRAFEEKKLLRAVITRSAPAAGAISAPAAPQPLRSDMPEIIIRHADTLPAPAWDVNACSASTNAAGCAPIPILYLWVFQASSSQYVFETHGWPQLGPVHLLLNCSALPIQQLRRAKDTLLLGDPKVLTSMVAAYNDAADIYDRPQLFVTLNTSKTHYRGYPIHTLVCTDTLWQDAFHAVAQRSQLAVFNLSGYNPGHPGLEYEIRHVLSGGPPRRCVFVYNRHTDADGAIDSVIETWRKVPEFHDQVKQLVFLRYQDPQLVGYGQQFQPAPRMLAGMAKSIAEHEGAYRPTGAAIVEFLNSLDGSSAS